MPLGNEAEKQEQCEASTPLAMTQTLARIDFSALGLDSAGKLDKAALVEMQGALSILLYAVDSCHYFAEGKVVSDDMRQLAKTEIVLLLQLFIQHNQAVFPIIAECEKQESQEKNQLRKELLQLFGEYLGLSFVEDPSQQCLSNDLKKFNYQRLGESSVIYRYSRLKHEMDSSLFLNFGAHLKWIDKKLGSKFDEILMRLCIRGGLDLQSLIDCLSFCIEQYAKIFEPYLQMLTPLHETYRKNHGPVSFEDFKLFREAFLKQTANKSWQIEATLVSILHQRALYPELEEHLKRDFFKIIRETGCRWERLRSSNSILIQFVDVLNFDIVCSRFDVMIQYRKALSSEGSVLTINQYILEEALKEKDKDEGMFYSMKSFKEETAYLLRQPTIPLQHRMITPGLKKLMKSKLKVLFAMEIKRLERAEGVDLKIAAERMMQRLQDVCFLPMGLCSSSRAICFGAWPDFLDRLKKKQAQGAGGSFGELIIFSFLQQCEEDHVQFFKGKSFVADFSGWFEKIKDKSFSFREEAESLARSVLAYQLDQWMTAENCDLYLFTEEYLYRLFWTDFSAYPGFEEFIPGLEKRKSILEMIPQIGLAQSSEQPKKKKQERELLVAVAKVMRDNKVASIQKNAAFQACTDFLRIKFIDENFPDFNALKSNLFKKGSKKKLAQKKLHSFLKGTSQIYSVSDWIGFYAAAKDLLNFHRNPERDSQKGKENTQSWELFLPKLQKEMLVAVVCENEELKKEGRVEARRAMLDFVKELKLFDSNKEAQNKVEQLIGGLPYPVSNDARDAFQQKLTTFKAGPLKDVDLVTQRKGLSKKFEAFTGDFTTIEEFVLFFDAIGYRHDGKTAGEDTDGLTLLRKENRSASSWGGQFGHTKTSQSIAEKAIEQLKALVEGRNSEVTPAQDAMCRYVLTMKIARGPGNKKAKVNLKWYEDKVTGVENPDVQAERASEEMSASTSASSAPA